LLAAGLTADHHHHNKNRRVGGLGCGQTLPKHHHPRQRQKLLPTAKQEQEQEQGRNGSAQACGSTVQAKAKGQGTGTTPLHHLKRRVRRGAPANRCRAAQAPPPNAPRPPAGLLLPLLPRPRRRDAPPRESSPSPAISPRGAARRNPPSNSSSLRYPPGPRAPDQTVVPRQGAVSFVGLTWGAAPRRWLRRRWAGRAAGGGGGGRGGRAGRREEGSSGGRWRRARRRRGWRKVRQKEKSLLLLPRKIRLSRVFGVAF
jgi:hypothetical protein